MTALSNAEALIGVLDSRKISYSLELNRAHTLMVLFATPGYRWEVEFLDDDTIEVEKFISQGVEAVGIRDLEHKLQVTS